MRNFEIKLSEDSVQSMIDILEEFKQHLKDNQIPEKLAEVGANAAEAAYGFPVSVETGDDRASVIASHEGLPFLEFGAGITTNENHIYASEVEYPVYQGSYSDQNHGMYQQTGYQYWVFGGEVYDRVVPRGGMLAAGTAIRDTLEDVVREAVWY